MKPGRPSALEAVRRLKRDEIVKLVGLVAAALVGVLVNVYSARHYSRWDVTKDRRYTLSEATKRTLHDLTEPVEIWVVLGQSEALRQTVAQLLVAYQAETSRLVVKFVDPDHDALALEDLKKRFRVEAGRSEDGHVVTDAAIIVARGAGEIARQQRLDPRPLPIIEPEQTRAHHPSHAANHLHASESRFAN